MDPAHVSPKTEPQRAFLETFRASVAHKSDVTRRRRVDIILTNERIENWKVTRDW